MLDLDGLQVAYLGVALAHYLDLETGDILDLPLDAEVKAVIGEKVYAAETVLAWLKTPGSNQK